MPQIEKSKYFGSYLEIKYFLQKILNFKSNISHDTVYLSRLQPVGDAPTKMDQKYTPPQHCVRFSI
jgi:hypothetical protein